MIGIVNYGLGNLAAFEVAFRRLGRKARLIDDPAGFDDADALILPGVGAFDVAMTRLAQSGLESGLRAAVSGDRPVLGVCVGMQMLATSSEEGRLPGLSFISGTVRKFQTGGNQHIRCPHMGWNRLTTTSEGPLTQDLDQERFYFLHSYYFDCDSQADIIGTSEYGGRFASFVGHRNVFGVQFHPEKSHDAGLRLLDNFARLAA